MYAVNIFTNICGLKIAAIIKIRKRTKMKLVFVILLCSSSLGQLLQENAAKCKLNCCRDSHVPFDPSIFELSLKPGEAGSGEERLRSQLDLILA